MIWSEDLNDHKRSSYPGHPGSPDIFLRHIFDPGIQRPNNNEINKITNRHTPQNLLLAHYIAEVISSRNVSISFSGFNLIRDGASLKQDQIIFKWGYIQMMSNSDNLFPKDKI